MDMVQKAKTKPEDPEDDLIGSVEEGEQEAVSTDLFDVLGGVSAHWLQQVFGGDRAVVKRKLASGRCKVVGRLKGAPLYNLKEAAACLVKPKFDVDEYMQSMRYNDLPPMLQAAYWDGRKKRQDYEIKAGDLWHTADVLAVLGDLAFSIKTSVSLWVEEVERQQPLTPAQRKIIVEQADKLLDEVHQVMLDAPKRSQTPSSVADPLEEEDAADEV